MTTLLTVCAPFATTSAWAGGPTISYNIPAGDASKTLQVYLQQTRIEMLYRTDNVRGRQTNAVNGTFEASEALERMLAGTDLQYNFTPDFSFAAVKAREEEQPGTAEPPRVDIAKASMQTASRDEPARLKSIFGDQPIDEVVVTGTLIRGVQDMTSPLEFITKRELKKTPYATVQDALQAMTVNMGSPFNEVFGGTGNFARGSAVNLRGLGAGATLVLVNGRRQMYSGLQADFVDLSGIPWSAVERIEVLPDGASALYGSDAIAGVVNVILRQDESGAETQARYGMAQGGADQKLISQLLGTSWDGGKALFSYQYAERTGLPASAREYTANEDQRRLGGTDHRSTSSNPGNILDPETFLPAYAIPLGQNGSSLTAADLIPGAANFENRNASDSLLPNRKTHSVYVSASQNLGGRFELFADGRISKLDIRALNSPFDQILFVPSTNAFAAKLNPYPDVPFTLVGYNFGDDLGPIGQTADVRSQAGTLGVKARAGETWSLSLSGSHGSETLRYVGQNQVDPAALFVALADSNPATAFNPFGDGSNTNPSTIEKIRSTARQLARSQISAVNLVADGTLLNWAMGPVRLATGGEWREETLERATSSGSIIRPRTDFGRIVRSAFAELSVPLIGDPNNARAVPRLELSLAGRYEKYSDFGTSTNPKIGLRWVPIDSLKLRTSWGTSFRAPKLTDVYDSSHDSSGLVRFQDPKSPTGSSIVLVKEGSNPRLHQEVAQTWTAGIDVTPSSFPGLGVSLTFYSIDYDDRIAIPGSARPADILFQEDTWARVIKRQPTQAEVDEVCDSSTYAGGPAAQCRSTPVAAIVDFRLQNLAATRVRGLDLKIDHSLETSAGRFDLGLNGGYVLSFREASSTSSPMNSVLDTVGNPLAFRLRGMIDWSRHGFDEQGFSAGLTIDHFGSYKDSQTSANASVNPWTTIDVRTGYRTPAGNGTLDGLEFSLIGSNVLDHAPPFVDRSMGYDVINAQPYGRVISFSVQKRW